MSEIRCVKWHRLLMLFVVSIPCVALGDEGQPPMGTKVGQWIPTTTTWVVIDPGSANREGHNTCLAGVNRKKRAISIYAREESPELWSLLKIIDDGIKDQSDLAAYVVIHKSLSDEAGYNRSQERFNATQQVARQQKFSRLVVSLSRDSDTQLLPSQERLRIVYSDHRITKLSRGYRSIDVEPDPLKQLLAEILALAKEQR